MTSHNNSEFSVGEFKLRHGWRLRLWFVVDRIRVRWQLRKWTPEQRDALKRAERAIDRAMMPSRDENSRHVMPVGDLVEHQAQPDCVCGPTPEAVRREDGSVGWLYTHHSLDGREC